MTTEFSFDQRYLNELADYIRSDNASLKELATISELLISELRYLYKILDKEH